ncbi:MAG: hypothetical protein HY420_04525 [Candidatus Kerfeldbacteria bacterium]|nr:hypothetical protein [Candidatus Kerfeldbacteria bacterium]
MKLTTFLGAFLAVMMLAASSAAALTINSEQTVIIDSASSIKDVFAGSGGTVDLAGSFADDVFVGGGTVTVSGPVAGDLFVGGGTVKVTGEVKGSVRVAGGTLELDGRVGRNATLFGGTISLGKNADVAGETIIFGGNVTIDGHAGKLIQAWGGSFRLNGSSDSDVRLYTFDDCGRSPCVSVGPNAAIKGNFTYTASQDARIDGQAKISGQIERKEIAISAKETKKLIRQIFTVGRLWSLFSLLVVGLLIALLLPRTVRQVAATMVKRVGPTVGFGALIFFATPLVLILLALTLIGIPLALILAGLYIVGLYTSQVFLGFFVGDTIIRRFRRTPPAEGKPLSVLWPTLLGIAVLSVVFDFALGIGGLTEGLGFVGNFIISVIRLFLLLWPFGALVLVKWGYVREKEA